jgi:BMFP domain-containing protein YqiC
MPGLNRGAGIAIVLSVPFATRSVFEMTQTSFRFFDEIGRLMNDAAGAAQGVKREVDSVMRNQAERILRDLDVVKRDDFESVKEMAKIAREENEALKARIAALEARFKATPPDAAPPIGEPSAVPPEKAAPNVTPNEPFQE